MKIRGIKRGQTIEILEQINNIPDGTEIIIDLEFIEKQISQPQLTLTVEEKLAKLNKLFGTWKNQPDLTSIFAEIDQQRHAYQGRNIDLILKFLPKLSAEAYTALQHIEIIASPEDWQKITYQIARTLVDAQYEITHRQIMEQMKVDNLDEIESDDDILAAALKLTS